MMSNVFSLFDPSTSYMSLNWTMAMVPLMGMSMMVVSTQSKKMIPPMSIITLMSKESEGGPKASKTVFPQLMKSMFMCCLMVNVVAIMPFNFTPTAHMSMTLYIGLSMWMGTMVNASSNSLKKTLSHLTPMGTPTALMNFMVLIEMVSLMIRPITLAVRLMANMVAGHLLLSLLSSLSMTTMMTFSLSSIPMMALLTLETAVAMIQAYVITTLISLYYSESF